MDFNLHCWILFSLPPICISDLELFKFYRSVLGILQICFFLSPHCWNFNPLFQLHCWTLLMQICVHKSLLLWILSISSSNLELSSSASDVLFTGVVGCVENNLQQLNGINVDELAKFRTFFNSLDKPSGGTSSSSCSLSQGNPSTPLCLRASEYSHPIQWILDSGATEHMTNCPQFYHSFHPCPKPKQVLTANSSVAQVKGHGTIDLLENLSL